MAFLAYRKLSWLSAVLVAAGIGADNSAFADVYQPLARLIDEEATRRDDRPTLVVAHSLGAHVVHRALLELKAEGRPRSSALKSVRVLALGSGHAPVAWFRVAGQSRIVQVYETACLAFSRQ